MLNAIMFIVGLLLCMGGVEGIGTTDTSQSTWVIVSGLVLVGVAVRRAHVQESMGYDARMQKWVNSINNKGGPS